MAWVTAEEMFNRVMTCLDLLSKELDDIKERLSQLEAAKTVPIDNSNFYLDRVRRPEHDVDMFQGARTPPTHYDEEV